MGSLSPVPEVVEDDIVETELDPEFKLFHPKAAEENGDLEERRKEMMVDEETELRLQLPEWLRCVRFAFTVAKREG